MPREGGDWALTLEELARHIHVQRVRHGTSERTRVTVNHRLPPRRRRLSRDTGALLITTSGNQLAPEQFGPAAQQINKASRERGRGLYCLDSKTHIIIAALS